MIISALKSETLVAEGQTLRSWLDKYMRYWQLVQCIPDSSQNVSGKLCCTDPLQCCEGAFITITETGIGAPILYAIDNNREAIDTQRQLRSFAQCKPIQSISFNVTTGSPSGNKYTHITIPLLKSMLAVWLQAYDGKLEARLNNTTVTLCIGCAFDRQNGEGIYFSVPAEKGARLEDVELTSIQQQLLTEFLACVKSFRS